MLQHLGRGLTFIAGSVIGGLALAFVAIALRPELIRGSSGTTAASAPLPAPAGTADRASYAVAVERAAPAVVNVYTERLVTELVPPSLGGLFGFSGTVRHGPS